MARLLTARKIAKAVRAHLDTDPLVHAALTLAPSDFMRLVADLRKAAEAP